MSGSENSSLELVNEMYLRLSANNSFPVAEDVFKLIFGRSDTAIDTVGLLAVLTIRKVPLNSKVALTLTNDVIIATVHLTNFISTYEFELNEFVERARYAYIIIENNWYPLLDIELNVINSISIELNKQDTELKKMSAALNYRGSNLVQFNWEEEQFKHFVFACIKESSSRLFQQKLYGYQENGLKWLKYSFARGTGVVLGDDMGLGKTAQVIAFLAWLIEEKLSRNILVVVPSTLLENWRREFLFFSPDIQVYQHHGGQRSGSIGNLTSCPVVLTSYSMVVNDIYLLNKIEWDLIVADEASLIKNSESERRTSISSLSRKMFIAMTGTPVENSLMDLWSIGDIVAPGEFGTNQEFAEKYIKPTIDRTIAESDLGELRQKLGYLLIRRKKEEVLLDLPPRIDIHQALEMSDNEINGYETIRTNVLKQVEGKSPAQIFALIQHLRQYTTHPVLTMDKAEKDLHSSPAELIRMSNKLQRTAEILDEIAEAREKVLVFTEYINMIDLFVEFLSKRYEINIYQIDGRTPIENRQNEIDRFSAEKGFSIMILNPRTAGMGLNITAANHVIHYTRQWNPALEEQASARAYRNKQENPVNIYYLYYVDSIEEYMDNRLRLKKQLSSEVVSEQDFQLSDAEMIESVNVTPKKQ